MPEEINKILAIIRRYAEAIADGTIDAKKVAGMTDEELAAYDDELVELLGEKQIEAERLAGVKK